MSGNVCGAICAMNAFERATIFINLWLLDGEKAFELCMNEKAARSFYCGLWIVSPRMPAL